MVRVETDMPAQMGHVRFSNRPSGVKRFQTIRHHSDDVARGLVLLFGIGTRALPIMGFEDGVEQSSGPTEPVQPIAHRPDSHTTSTSTPQLKCSSNGLEAISLCDFGSFSLFAGNWAARHFGSFATLSALCGRLRIAKPPSLNSLGREGLEA